MTAKWYIPEPRPIQAVQWMGDLEDIPLPWRETGMLTLDEDGSLLIQTLDGLASARLRDYLVHGTAAEFYPIRQPIFLFKYREAEQ